MLNNYFPLTALTAAELSALLPLFILGFGAIITLLAGAHKTKGHDLGFFFSFATLVGALVVGASNLEAADVTILQGTLTFTAFTKTLNLMVLVFALIGVTITYGQDKKELLLGEIYALTVFSVSGMILMLSTTHLILMFIALEIMSLAIYVMVAMRRSSRFSAEAGMKYFILGGLASALLLYGSSLIFGAFGTFQLVSIKAALIANPTAVSPIFFIGLGLVVVAMLFKVGAFPFHGWIPDVYQGASTNVTAYMGAAVKFTAFLAFATIVQNLVFVSVPELKWFQLFIWLVSAASMIYGNFVAISQTELKRMLSFSTIAHSGYLLLGLYAMNLGSESSQSLVLYLFFYALANLGAFAVIALFEERNQKDLTLDQIAGIGLKHPFLGAFMTIFLLSMAGIPLTSGFIGKYGLFNSAVNAGEVPLVVIAVLTSVVSVYYYLRVIVYLFMKESTTQMARIHRFNGASLAALVSAAATLQFGIFPKAIIHFIKMIAK